MFITGGEEGEGGVTTFGPSAGGKNPILLLRTGERDESTSESSQQGGVGGENFLLLSIPMKREKRGRRENLIPFAPVVVRKREKMPSPN